MPNTLLVPATLLAAYLLGSIPFGLAVAGLFARTDVRKVHSGRTGGTNVMRVAGFWAGLTTALLDIGKGALAVLLSRWLLPDLYLAHVLCGALAVLGHNHSIFLIERKRDDTGRMRIRLGGGAGGATTVGGAIGLWPWNWIIIPLGAVVLFGIGYASVATMSVGILSIIIMAILFLIDSTTWPATYILYGFFAFVLQVLALRPNIVRLVRGEERLVGWRAKRRERRQAQADKNEQKVRGNAEKQDSPAI